MLTVEELLACIELLQSVVDLAGSWQGDHPNARKAAELQLIIPGANSYLVDLARGLKAGDDIDEALSKAITGDRPLSPEESAAMDNVKRSEH